MLNTGMSSESYAMGGIVSGTSMLVIGSILIYSLFRAARRERKDRAMHEPLMSG